MNKISSQIENHQFIEEVSKDQIIPIVEKLHQDKDYSLSELEQYSLSVFMWSMRIRDCFEILEHASVYLKYFRNNKQYKEAGIGRSHHINYHYFNYAITVVKIMDVSLILTDKTFRLGNPEKLCRLENIIENSWVQSAGVDKLLKELNSVVEPWREPRNLFIHRGERLKGKSMYILEAYDLAASRGESIPNSSPFAAREWYKEWYKEEISRIDKEFKQTEIPLFNATSNFLLGLLSIYNFWRKTLKQTSGE